MDVNICNKYDDLPLLIRNKLIKEDLFCLEIYFNYLKNKVFYLYNNDCLIIVQKEQKFIFRYGLCISQLITFTIVEPAEKKYFLDKCMNILKTTLKIQWVTNVNHAVFDVFPTYSKRIPFGSFIIDLQLSEEALWNKIHKNHRNRIRVAEKNGVEIRFGPDLIKDYILLDSVTWRRSNKKGMSESFLSELIDSFPDNNLLAVAYKDDKPQGGAFLLFNNKTSYYLNGASCNVPEQGAVALLQWRCIQYIKAKSVHFYDFVGCRINEDPKSKYQGIQDFKRRFGGELVSGYLFKVIFNRPMYLLFRMVVSIKNRTRYQDIVDQEIHKWKELNL